jgi:predicted Fe-S protein YdhL (DUF1289 family)
MRYECYTGSEELCKNLCLRAAQEIRDKNRMMLETQQELLKSLMRPIAGLEEDVTA